MRIKVLAKREGFAGWKAPFQPGPQQHAHGSPFEEDDAVRKKGDGPDSDGQDALKKEKKQISCSEQRKRNRRILLYCVLGIGHVEWTFWQPRFGDDFRMVLRSSRSSELNVLPCREASCHLSCRALVDSRGLRRPDCRNE
jgi:hypothetical protein